MSISRNQPKLKPVLQIHYCAAGPIRDDYSAGMVRIPESKLADWIFEQIRNGKPLLITDMDEI